LCEDADKINKKLNSLNKYKYRYIDYEYKINEIRKKLRLHQCTKQDCMGSQIN